MGTWGIGHWLIVLVIGLLLFGKRLPSIGGDIASAIKGFRKGLQDEDPAAQAQLKADPDPAAPPASSESKRENTP
jgi:sec-independent protein translocase protein TatA